MLGIGATLLASCSGNKQKAEEKTTPQKPNVIFLIADDIGYGDLSCNGSKTIHTPNVEKLAALYGCTCSGCNQYALALLVIHRALCLATE